MQALGRFIFGQFIVIHTLLITKIKLHTFQETASTEYEQGTDMSCPAKNYPNNLIFFSA